MNSYFYQNSGLKKSNGGAVTIFCDYLSNYYSSSELKYTSGIYKYSVNNQITNTLNLPITSNNNVTFNMPFFNNKTTVTRVTYPVKVYNIMRESTVILNC